MEVQKELLSILLVTSGSRGDRLLFKYPFEVQQKKTSVKSRYTNILKQFIINMVKMDSLSSFLVEMKCLLFLNGSTSIHPRVYSPHIHIHPHNYSPTEVAPIRPHIYI